MQLTVQSNLKAPSHSLGDTPLEAKRTGATTYAPIAIAALAGFALIAVATRNGIGLSVDSAFYISVARELAAGNGLTVPWGTPEPTAMGTRWAPLMPGILAAVAQLGIDPVDSVRWVNAICLAGTAAICGFAIRRVTRSLALGVLVACMIVTSRTMLAVFAMAWSEPIFILCATLSLVLLAEFLRTRRMILLVATLTAVSAACLTRYAGASLAVAAFACLLLQPGRWLIRSLAAACAALMAFAPMYPGGPTWIAWMQAHRGGLTEDAHHSTALEVLRIHEGLDAVTQWLWPWGLAGGRSIGAAYQMIVVTGAVVALIVVTISSWRHLHQKRASTTSGEELAAAAGVFLAAYLILIIAAVTLFGRTVSFNHRILLPLFPPAAVMIAVGCKMLQAKGRLSPRIVRGSAALCLLFVGIRAIGAVDYCGYIASGHGFGAQNYQHASWRTSPTIRELDRLPPNATIYSNAPDAIYLLTGRNAIWASLLDRPEGNPDAGHSPPFPNKASPAYLVFFDRLSWRPSSPKRDEIAAWPLSALARAQDGEIFAFTEVVSCSELPE